MSALTSPLDSLPDAVGELPVAVIAGRRGLLGRLPLKAKVGGVILATFIVIAVIGPWIAPYDPSATIPSQVIPRGPSSSHLLGTTASGQDILSQLLVGIRSTVVLGLLTGLIATTLSILVGVTAGFLGGSRTRGCRCSRTCSWYCRLCRC